MTFKKARQEILNPATLKRLIVDLIEPEDWMSMRADVKGDIDQFFLAKSAQESPKGAGQYFRPRELIKAIVACCAAWSGGHFMCDPAIQQRADSCRPLHDYVVREHGIHTRPRSEDSSTNGLRRGLGDRARNRPSLREEPRPARDRPGRVSLIRPGMDSLANCIPASSFRWCSPTRSFAKKSSGRTLNEEGELETESNAYERQDFWTGTKNKQWNGLQHVTTLLEMHGSWAIVIPDNVLFEGGAGGTVRRNLLQAFDVHTLLRLPTGIFYRPRGQGECPVLRREACAGEVRGPSGCGSTISARTSPSP